MDAERLPPHDVDAEEAVIGTAMLDGAQVLSLAVIVKPDHFYRERNALVFQAAVSLANAGEPVDQITVADLMNRRDQLESVGGQEYLAHAIAQVPTPVYGPHYAQIVRNHAERRMWLRVGGDVAAAAYDMGDIEAGRAKLAQIWSMAVKDDVQGGPLPVGDVTDAAVERLSRMFAPRGNRDPLGLSTGFIDLDTAIDGLQGGRVYTVGARTSMGKSEFVINVARNVAQAGHRVVFFVNEGRVEGFIERLAYQIARVDKQDLRDRSMAEDTSRRLNDALIAVTALPIHVLARPETTSGDIRIHIMSQLQRFDDIGLVVVDQLDLLRDEGANENDRRARAMDSLVATAIMTDLPFLVTAQLNRQVEGRADRMPSLADFRHSGNIEQHSDTALLLHYAWYYRQRGQRIEGDTGDSNLLQVIVAKNRDGATGLVKIHWEPAVHEMRDWVDVPRMLGQ